MKDLLPIGSVIELIDKNEKDYYIIIGRRRKETDKYDYTCVKYPYGFVDKLYYINDSDIKNIVHFGDINY